MQLVLDDNDHFAPSAIVCRIIKMNYQVALALTNYCTIYVYSGIGVHWSRLNTLAVDRLDKLTGNSICPQTVTNHPHRVNEREGDSSVVTRWTVDQEVVGSNPTHGGNLISVVRSLSGFTRSIR